MNFRDAWAVVLGLGLAGLLWGRPEWSFGVGLAGAGTAWLAWRRSRRLGELARDLHDGLGSHLAAPVLASESAGPGRELRERAEDALAELRHVLACAHRRLDLEAAVRSEACRAATRSGWRLDCRVELGGRRLADELGLELLRCLQELLCNAARHAGAARVGVELTANGRWVELVVEDDGCGLSAVPQDGLHFGLHHLAQRARSRGGELRLGASEGGGARISLRFRRARRRRRSSAARAVRRSSAAA